MDAGLLRSSATTRGPRIVSSAPAKGLPADQLEFVVHGTFGGLGATLRHLVEAEERYVRGLRGETTPGPDAARGTDRPVPPEALAPSVRVLRRRAAASAAALIELAETTAPDAVVVARYRGELTIVRAITFFAQALDHGWSTARRSGTC